MSEDLIKRLREANIDTKYGPAVQAIQLEAADRIEQLEAELSALRQAQEGSKQAIYSAVSAIYFDDSSDYLPALYDVVTALSPEIAGVLTNYSSAAYESAKLLIAAAPTAGSANE